MLYAPFHGRYSRNCADDRGLWSAFLDATQCRCEAPCAEVHLLQWLTRNPLLSARRSAASAGVSYARVTLTPVAIPLAEYGAPRTINRSLSEETEICHLCHLNSLRDGHTHGTHGCRGDRRSCMRSVRHAVPRERAERRVGCLCGAEEDELEEECLQGHVVSCNQGRGHRRKNVAKVGDRAGRAGARRSGGR